MVEPMTDARLDELLAEIQCRILAEDARRRRRNRWAATLGGAAACVAVTGGALVVAQATDTEKSVAVCYQAASTQSHSAEVGAVPIDGTLAAVQDTAARVGFAEAQCTVVWQIGLLSSESTPAQTSPALFTCVLADGRLGVFPAEQSAGCQELGLREP